MAITREIIKDVVSDVVERIEGCRGVGSGDEKRKTLTEAKLTLDVVKSMSSGAFRRGDGGLWIYTGKKYEFLEERDIESVVSEILKSLEVGQVYQVNSVSVIKKMAVIDMGFKDFSPKLRYLGMNNGVLDLDEGILKEFSSELESRVSLAVDYDANAKCPLWEKFLVEVIGEKESIMVLQEFLGLVFVDKRMFHVETMLYLFGYGANGKGVVYDLIHYILGANCSSYSLQQLCTHQNSDYYTAEANGKLLNFCSDMGDQDFSGGRYKQLVSREPISVRPIGRAPFEARDMPLLAANINKLPVTSDSSDGHWRRSKIIVFSKTFSEKEQDKTLKEKIKRETSGIFNWIMRGRERLIQNKGQFTDSGVIRETVENARIDSNSTLAWMQDRGYYSFSKLPEGAAYDVVMDFTSNFYQDYTEFCKDVGSMSKKQSNFLQDLNQAGIRSLKSMRRGDKVTSGREFYVLQKKEKEIDKMEDLPF